MNWRAAEINLFQNKRFLFQKLFHENLLTINTFPGKKFFLLTALQKNFLKIALGVFHNLLHNPR